MDLSWIKYYPQGLMDKIIESSTGLYGGLLRMVAKVPDNNAIEYSEATLSYRELLTAVDEAAVAFDSIGIDKDSITALFVGGIPATVISSYALDKIGSGIVFCYPDEKKQRIIEILSQTSADTVIVSYDQYNYMSSFLDETGVKRIIVCSLYDFMSPGFAIKERFARSVEGKAEKKLQQDSKIPIYFWRNLVKRGGSEHDFLYDVRDHDEGRFIFTNGLFEHEAKGCLLSGSAIDTFAEISSFLTQPMKKKMKRPARVLCLIDKCYVFGFVYGIHCTLMNGNCACLSDKYNDTHRKGAISSIEPDVIVGFPTQFSNIPNVKHLKSLNFSFLKEVIVCAGTLSAEARTAFQTFMNRHGSKCRITEIIGLGETIGTHYMLPEWVNDKSVGIPLPGVLCKVVDRNGMEELPVGQTGDLCVCTPCLMNGYLNDESLTEKHMFKMKDGRTWFFPDIKGYCDENGMFYMRNDDVREYEIGGVFVDPVIVDSVISNVYGVEKCCTVSIEDETGVARLIVEVVPNERLLLENDRLVDLKNEIEKECEMMLPKAMRPTDVEFRVYLPVLSDGRVDYKTMLEQVKEERLERQQDSPEIKEENV